MTMVHLGTVYQKTSLKINYGGGRQEKKEKGSMIQLYDETFKEWEDGRIVIDKN